MDPEKVPAGDIGVAPAPAPAVPVDVAGDAREGELWYGRETNLRGGDPPEGVGPTSAGVSGAEMTLIEGREARGIREGET